MRFRIVRLSKIVWIASAFAASSVTLAADERTALKQVDLQLVVTVDVSRPMDRDEAIVARNGYIEAFRSPRFIQAVTRGSLGRIAVTFVEWSDPQMQTMVVPRTIIDGSAAANEFANRLNQAPMQWLRSTSISGALLFSAAPIEKSGFSARRSVIDVSGKGPNNAGVPVITARDAVVTKGLIINGLPIDLGPREAVIENLAEYYDACVIEGPGAFSTSVGEISQLPVAAIEPTSGPIVTMVQATSVDCKVGEKLHRGLPKESDRGCTTTDSPQPEDGRSV
jgi:Protein of unknown function (DUF1194)